MKHAVWVWLAGLFLLTACHKPREIPDDKLVAIVSDLFLANAYWSGIGFVPDSLRFDSVDIYTPVFKHYGYRPEDFTHTIRNLSKRKSIRLSDLMENATKRLENEASGYFTQVANMDTLSAMASRFYQRTVYLHDSLRTLTRLSRPEDKPDISVPLLPGRYRVEFVYLVDTADRSSYLQYFQRVRDTADRYSNNAYRSFTKGKRRREEILLEMTDTARYKELEIFLAYTGTKEWAADRPSGKTLVKIDSMRVIHLLPPAEALDSFTRRILFPSPWPEVPHLPLDAQTPENHVASYPKDLVTLRLDTARVAPLADTLVRPWRAAPVD